jgi:hypothetical protein
MARFAQATVIGDSDPPRATRELAREVGAIVAELGLTLVTGGREGVMEEASRAAAEAGGLVVGIVPGSDFAQANRWCEVVVPTGLGHARNALTPLAGDVVIAIGGGAGTLSELCFAWMHEKPILALASGGGWAAKLAGARLDARRRDAVVECRDAGELSAQLARICDERGLRRRE